MAIIYSYPETLELLPADMLIGTSTIRVAGKKKNITKNFTLELLKNFILDGFTNVQWGTITGTLSNQTDLQAALNAKQNNITLTTIGSAGPATLVGSTLNVPDYSTGIMVPTLNQVLTAGNTSIIDAKVGNLYSYDNINADYGIVQFYDSGVSLKSATTNHLLFFNDDTGTVKFSNGTYLPTLNFAGVGNNIYTFQNANGTLAFTSDIPSLAGYVPTSRTLSINGTLYDLTADRSWSVGTVTSVALSMPSAFTVTNSPITGAGTIAVVGAGTASQYVRGDGQLATFPSGGGGGSSVNYYLNGSIAASVAPYKQMSNTAIIGPGTNFALLGNGLIAQFLTDVGNPNRIEIPGGAWNFEMFFSMSSNGGTPAFYVELLKYNGATFTSIASSSAVPENITGGTSNDLHLTSLAVPTTTLLATDRLAIRIYIVNNSGGRTATLHTEDSNLCEIITTFSGGVTSLNGLTANTQYLAVGTAGTDFNISSATDTHTFNLPTASAANRGALNSADWSTFNGKFNLPSLTSGSVLFSNGTTIAQDNAQLFWDDTNNRLGIGTNAPIVALDIYGTGTVQSRIVSASGGDIRFSVDTLGRMGTYSNSSLSLLTNSVSRLLIDTAGNVGIGTSTPSSKLQINDTTAFAYSAAPNVSAKIGASGTGGSFLVNTPSANSSYESGLAIDGTYTGGKSVININAFGVYSGGPYSADLAFKTSTNTTLSEKMRITNAGNVGIGTTSPTAKLHVAAPGALSTDIALRVRNSADTADLLSIAGNGNSVINGSLRIVSTPSVGNVNRPDEVGAAFQFGNGNNTSYGEFRFKDAGGTDLARLSSTGNLGIGTTAPTTKLHITGITQIVESGNTAFYGGNYVRVFNDQNFNIRNSAGTTIANISVNGASYFNGGNVGIGEATPTAKLHIKAPGALSTDIALRVRNSADSGDLMTVNGLGNVTLGAGGYIYGDTTTPFLRLSQTNGSFLGYGNSGVGLFGSLADIYSTDRITFQTNSSERMRINSTGNVGIGTTIPPERLSVSTTDEYLTSWQRTGISKRWAFGADAGGTYFSNRTDSVLPLYITNTGNIGIGTTSPVASAKLDVTSTTQGVLFPRMTTTQKNAIASPATGLVVFDTTLNKLCVRGASAWETITSV